MSTRFRLLRWEPHLAVDTVHRRADRWLARAAALGSAAARERAPVRTGFLRSSIIPLPVRRLGGRSTAGIWAAAPYALWVEIGTRRMAAQPYLRPALNAVRTAADLMAQVRATERTIQ